MAIQKKKKKSKYVEIGTYVPKGMSRGVKMGVMPTKSGPRVLISFIDRKYDDEGNYTDYNVSNKNGNIANVHINPNKTKAFRELFDNAVNVAKEADDE